MSTPIALALLSAGLLCALWAALTAYATWRLLTLPRTQPRSTPDDLGISYEDVCVTTADGVQLRGWYFPLADAPAIIYCGGRGRGLGLFDFRHALLFQQGGFQVLMLDWRGMGASDGGTSMGYWEGLDLRAAVTYTQRRAGAVPIGAYGASLGAAVLYRHGADIPELRAIAGECGFASFRDMIAEGMVGAHNVPPALARPLSWTVARLAAYVRRFPLARADPADSIGAIAPRPVLLIHGEFDRHVTPAAAQRLYAAAGQPKEIWITPTGHTSALATMGDAFGARLLAFFDHWLRS